MIFPFLGNGHRCNVAAAASVINYHGVIGVGLGKEVEGSVPRLPVSIKEQWQRHLE